MTNFQPGALSPRLEDFSWENLVPSELEAIVGPQSIGGFFPCMSLFIGSTLKSTAIPLLYDQGPLYLTAMQSFPSRLRNLTELELRIGVGDGEQHIRLLQQCLQSSTWQHLETLTIYPVIEGMFPYIGTPVIHLLASMPRLKRLTIHNMCESPAMPTSLPLSGFPSLTVLNLWTETLPESVAFLRHLPPDNNLKEVWSEVDINAEGDKLQDAIDAVGDHCNPLVLEIFDLEIIEYPEHIDEQLDFDESKGLDISPLLGFNKLTNLVLRDTTSIRLTSDLVMKVPFAWPRMKTLVLNPAHPSSQIPFINHWHFLTLVQCLPHLEHLALRFDATRLTGDEVAPDAPFFLKTLDVCDSPISSPSRTLKFLQSNLTLGGPPAINNFPEWQMPLYRKRWMEVESAWWALV